MADLEIEVGGSAGGYCRLDAFVGDPYPNMERIIRNANTGIGQNNPESKVPFVIFRHIYRPLQDKVSAADWGRGQAFRYCIPGIGTENRGRCV